MKHLVRLFRCLRNERGSIPLWVASVSGAYIERWFLDAPETHIFYIVYVTTCLIDGKVYIGKHKTSDLDDGYLGSGKLLIRAIRKHGIQNFQKEVLHVFDNENEMNLKESELVTEEFCNRDDTYNLCPGGKGGWGYVNQNGFRSGLKFGDTHSIKTKHILREKSIESHRLPARQEMMKDVLDRARNTVLERHPDGTMKGRHHSSATIEKMRLAKKGKRAGSESSHFGTRWMTDGVKNVKVKPEAISMMMSSGFTFGRIAPLV